LEGVSPGTANLKKGGQRHVIRNSMESMEGPENDACEG
jgi:hypothetical protein